MKFFLGGHSQTGCSQSGHRNLKLTVSQKGADGLSWFYACWYKFRKAKSWFNDFLGRSGEKWSWPFNSWELYLKNEYMTWADFLNADSDAIIFG